MSLSLFPFAQLLIPFVSQFRELLGLGEQLLGFLREGLQQAVVADLALDELLEVGPVGFLAVQVETVLAGLVIGFSSTTRFLIKKRALFKTLLAGYLGARTPQWHSSTVLLWC